MVVNVLSSHELEDVSWQMATIVNQTLLFCTSLEFIRFTYIPREWNKVVDCLAKWDFLVMLRSRILWIRGSFPLTCYKNLINLLLRIELLIELSLL